MLTFNKGDGFIHADLIEETNIFSVETITIEGDWHRVGDIIEDPEGGYRVAVEEIERPQPINDVMSFFYVGGASELVRG